MLGAAQFCHLLLRLLVVGVVQNFVVVGVGELPSLDKHYCFLSLSHFKLVSTECARTKTLLRLLELERDKARKTLTFIRSRRRRGDHTQACLRSGAHFREGLKGSSTKGVEQSCCPLRKASNYGKGEDAELTRIPPKKKTVKHFAISDHEQNHQ